MLHAMDFGYRDGTVLKVAYCWLLVSKHDLWFPSFKVEWLTMRNEE